MASVVFNGISRQIVCQAGVTSLNIKDVYSRWKDWVASGDNTKWLHAFEVAGGDPVSPKSVTTYFFLVNGWKIKAQDDTNVLSIDGIVLCDDGSDPFLRPSPPETLIIKQYATLTGGITRATLPDAIANSIVNNNYVESTFNFFTASRLMAAILSSYSPEEIIMKSDPIPNEDRIFAQSDANGDWLGISIFFSSYYLNGGRDGSSYIYDRYFGYRPIKKIECDAQKDDSGTIVPEKTCRQPRHKHPVQKDTVQTTTVDKIKSSRRRIIRLK